jgi:hypothetical protein
MSEHDSGPARIKFGPRDDDELPASWASGMLTRLKQLNPALFGKLLSETIGATRNGRG